MIKFIYSLVLITFVASEALNSEEQKELLDFHNIKRGSVKPSAANMLEMVYSKALENLAVDWVVWATSEELGCAVKRCDNIKPDWPKPIFLMACQYKPPGNFAHTKPYKDGASCSQCPHGTTCVNKLCSKRGPQTTTTTTAPSKPSTTKSSNTSSTTSTSSITWVGGTALFATILVYAFA
ncbi:Peptidase inhibitor 16 [Echinococcus granulosus]|nr:Peptidase inhibitor 16 [Echinococcus granulosus]